VIADLSTYQAFIGPLGAHHADVMNAVIPNWASQNPDYIENRYTWINLWPPGTYG